jgi:hypothetical protein
VQTEQCLLFNALDRHKAHMGPGYGRGRQSAMP